MHAASKAAFILFTALFVSSLRGQEAPCRTHTLFASVVSKAGTPIRGISPEMFTAKFRGHPARILSATLDTGPRRVVILIDESGSMVGSEPIWEATTMLAQSIVSTSPADVSLALEIFSENVDDRLDFAQDREEAWKKVVDLNNARPKLLKERHRGTAILDAMQGALKMLGTSQLGDSIYVITDGDDNKSSARPSDVEHALVSAGVRFFALLLPQELPDRMRTPEELANPTTFRHLAKASGGAVFSYIPQTANLAYESTNGITGYQYRLDDRDRALLLLIAQRLLNEIRDLYLLKVELPEEAYKPGDVSVGLTNEVGRKVPGVQLTSSRWISACSQN